MRKPFVVAATTLAVVLSLGLTACGSSDSSDEDSLTNAQLIEQADAICTEFNGELVQKINDLSPDTTTTQDDLNSFVTDEVVPLFTEEIAELRELTPSSDDEAAFNEIIGTLEGELQDLEKDPTLITQGGSAFPKATEMAKEFGLTACGSNSA